MSELRTRLERLGDRVRPPADAYERLERARRRRERNRRITAGVIALLLAVAGSLAAFSAFRGGEDRVGGQDDEFFALWPEQTAAGLAAAQERVDAGDPEFAWRADQVSVAERFATEVLAWPEALVITTETDPPSEISTVDLEVPPAARCDAIVTDAECPTGRVTLTMRRLGRSDGLWSVTEVHGDDLALPVMRGDDVVAGSTISVPTNLRDGSRVSMGVAFLSACGRRGIDVHVEARGGTLEFRVPQVSNGCTGYVYAMRPATEVGAVAVGSFLFTDAEAIPAIGYLVQEVAAVPVRFVAVSEEPPTESDSLSVSCDTRAISLDGALVAAQAGGVNVVVENASPGALSFQFAPSRLGPWGGIEVQPGMTELTLQAPPGAMTVRCWADGVATDELAVDVVDPQGAFVPYELTCPHQAPLELTIPVSAWPYVEPPHDPVEFVRGRVEGLLPSDVVERAGYPAIPNPVVRLVRDGAVVGSFELFQQFGRWEVSGVWCSELDIEVPSGPDPYPRGVFEWCPEFPFGEPGLQWEERASEAAIAFASAYVTGDRGAVDALLDESVPAGTSFPIELEAGTDPLVIATDGRGGELVNFGCGNDVDAYTAAITIDDGTDSASLNFTVYLVFRGAEGWKIWAVH